MIRANYENAPKKKSPDFVEQTISFILKSGWDERSGVALKVEVELR